MYVYVTIRNPFPLVNITYDALYKDACPPYLHVYFNQSFNTSTATSFSSQVLHIPAGNVMHTISGSKKG